jgi:hypothetical protein
VIVPTGLSGGTANGSLASVDAIRLLAASDLRRRWRAAVLIALLIGLIGAIVFATAAGARRSGTALDRFNQFSQSSDLEVDYRMSTPAQVSEFERQAGITKVGLVRAYALQVAGRPNLALGTSIDSSLGSVVDRARVIKGRLPNPNAVDEITVGEALAQQMHLSVGSAISTSSLSPQQLSAMRQTNTQPTTLAGPKPRLRVVGIVRRPLDLSNQAASGGVVILTPAFDRTYRNRIASWSNVLRLRVPHGAAGVPHVLTLANQIFAKDPFYQSLDEFVLNHGAQDAINVLTTALWILAAVTGLAGVVAITIILSREMSVVARDQSVLQAMGMTRRDRVLAIAPRAALTAGLGAVLAAVGAIALSPLFPVGIARRADPNTGVHIDWIAFGAGIAILAVFVLAVAFTAALRASRVVSPRTRNTQRRSLGDVVSSWRLRPEPANGLRMALDPGRDERAVPVRSAFVGATLGVVGLTAVLMFTGNLQHLVATPRAYGWTWDFKTPDAAQPAKCDGHDIGVTKVSGITDVAGICYENVRFENRQAFGWGFTNIRGDIEPTVKSGRAPDNESEVALGAITLQALHKKIGDTVHVSAGASLRDYRIVGTVLLPQLTYGDVQPLADGAAFTQGGLNRLGDPDQYNATRYIVGRFAPGTDRALALRQITARSAASESLGGNVFGQSGASGPTVPPEVDRVRHTAWFPPSIAVLVGFLALIAVGHALFTSVRRRRRELAVLKALGFNRHQVRATVAWQATAIAIVGLALGIPLGILVGRFAWAFAAHNIGVRDVSIIPPFALVVLAAVVLVAVNALAYFPARAASNIRPATALAAE